MASRNTDQKHTLILMPSGRRGQIPAGTDLLQAAKTLGVGIESICGGRMTCVRCLVKLEEGTFEKHGIISTNDHVSKPTPEEIELLKDHGHPDLRISCQAEIQGDLLVTIPEASRAQKQIIRKSASDRVIEVEPTIRQVYVEVEPAELGDHRGDWGRLKVALREQWELTELEIDLYALRRLQEALREKDWGVTVTLWDDRRVLDIQPGYQEGAYGLAVDVGSTTIAAYLCDLRTGDLLATEAMMNPQVSYGEDLMSRVSYATHQPQGMKKLHEAVLEALNSMAAKTARQAGIHRSKIYEIVLVGNTTMTHIFLGVPPDQLGQSPFALAQREAIDVRAAELGIRLHPAANAHVLPAQAGHVGADNVGVLIAEEPYLQDEIILTIDVGTNAEIVLSSPDWMYSASSPTGPAFEGGQISAGMRAAPGAIERVRIDPESGKARFRVIGDERWSEQWPANEQHDGAEAPAQLATGICGSGIIEVIAELFLSGLLTADGRFHPGVDSDYMVWDDDRKVGAYVLASAERSSTGKPILITQDDVRNIQLAKAALFAGARLLMKRAKVQEVDRIILAGAFGSYIDPKHAMVLGLIPDCDLGKVYAVGNAAGDGARIALLNRAKRQKAQEIAAKVQYIETAVDQDFQQEFVQAMHIPHQSDPYPHLKEILDEVPDLDPPKRKRRFRRRDPG